MSDVRKNFEHNFECALDSIPNGWVNSFINKFRDELFDALGEYADGIMFYQIKEKFGALTVYWNFPDKDCYTEKDYACPLLSQLHPADKERAACRVGI